MLLSREEKGKAGREEKPHRLEGEKRAGSVGAGDGDKKMKGRGKHAWQGGWQRPGAPLGRES